jgi:methanogenic corrinoid protein MtbC1
MSERTKLSREPVYNIRSVVERTGIAAETIRAWERRYGYPDPYRSPNGYRLYTEDEIATLIWLKRQTESGMSIGQSIHLLEALRSRGQEPTLALDLLPLSHAPAEDPVALRDELYSCLVSLHEGESVELLSRTFTGLPVRSALLQVIEPVLVRIGLAWHNGEIPVAIEHFASNLCRAHLIHAMESLSAPKRKGRIISACAPGELHEIGMLMVSFLLREAGWNVTYLGSDLSLERLHEALSELMPDLVLFSASSSESAGNLVDLTGVLNRMDDPRPLIGLGGKAFLENLSLANRIPGTLFGPKADDAVDQIEKILQVR